MEFFNWVTDFQLYRRQIPKEHQVPYEEFVVKRLKELNEVGAVPVRLMIEHIWKQEGQPYYNIHPKLAPKLCKVDLSKIPSPLFQMPHGKNVVNVRFAQQHDEFTMHDRLLTDNVTASGIRDRGVVPAGAFCRGFLMIDNRKIDWGKAQQDWLGNNGKGMVLFLIDFGVETKFNQPVYCVYGICPEENVSLEQALQRSGRDETNLKRTSYREMVCNILRLAVTIGFLSDNPALCEHDVLSKDRSKFDGGTEEERLTIINRAIRRGKNGYNIGNDLMFLGEQPKQSCQSSEATGRHLQYAHIRAGHPHAYRYGPGKNLVKIKWVAPTTVRDDLPFKMD